MINDIASEVLPVMVGVPQGFVFGPFLLNLFINNGLSCSPSIKSIFFADEAVFHVRGNALEAAVDKMYQLNSDLHSWLCMHVCIDIQQ